MQDEYSEKNTVVEVTVWQKHEESNKFIFYVNEKETDYEILEQAHEIALGKYGVYEELEFEKLED